MGSLASAIRRVHGYCLESGDALGVWLAQHRHVESAQARGMASMSHGVPFPSIRGLPHGAFPVYPERSPYYDARFFEDEP
jgi:hypothetical protein